MSPRDWTEDLAEDPELMDARIFASDPMNLRDSMLTIPLRQRFAYDSATNHFFVNLERFSVRGEDARRAADSIRHFYAMARAPLSVDEIQLGLIELASEASAPADAA